MRAVVQNGYGSADVLQPTAIDKPVITPSEVLVRVGAAGLDRSTWRVMTGQPYLMRLIGFGLRAPKNPVPGLDVAGTVAAVGAAVERFSVGDEVFGISRGAFAEYAAALEGKLAHRPASLSVAQAAVLPVSGLTALQGLRDVGHVTAGDRVLVLGASGGVGTYAVQLAKAFGAEVTGVCSAEKTDLVRSIGADAVVDYTREDFAAGGRRFDVILDIAGSSSLSRLRRVLEPEGTLVIVGGGEGGKLTGGAGRHMRASMLSRFVSQQLTLLMTQERHDDLEVLAELVEAGRLTPVVDRTYPLAEVAEAMRYLEAGHTRGKIAITV